MFAPDFRGGFELHSAEEVEKESHLLEELEKLTVSRERPHTSRAFTPLLDIPVDGYDSEAGLLRSSTSSRPMLPNWLLSRGDTDPHPPLRTDIGTIRSVHFDEVSLHSASASDRPDTDRGRSTSTNGVSKGRREKSGERSKEAVFTLQSAARRSRPALSQVFGSSPGEQVESRQVNGHQASSENGVSSSEREQEYQLKTVSISKTKQSLGKYLVVWFLCSGCNLKTVYMKKTAPLIFKHFIF